MDLFDLKEGNKITWDYDPKHRAIVKISRSNGNSGGGGE
jgi:hypothetical protein